MARVQKVVHMPPQVSKPEARKEIIHMLSRVLGAKVPKEVSKKTLHRLQSAVLTLRRNGGRFQNRYAFVKRTLRDMKLNTVQQTESYLEMRIRRLESENASLRDKQEARLEQMKRKNKVLLQDNILLKGNNEIFRRENLFLKRINEELRQKNSLLKSNNTVLRQNNLLLKRRASLDPALVLKRNDVMQKDSEEVLEGELGFKCPISHTVIKKAVLLNCGHVIGKKDLYRWWKQCPVNAGTCPKCRKSSDVVFGAKRGV